MSGICLNYTRHYHLETTEYNARLSFSLIRDDYNSQSRYGLTVLGSPPGTQTNFVLHFPPLITPNHYCHNQRALFK